MHRHEVIKHHRRPDDASFLLTPRFGPCYVPYDMFRHVVLGLLQDGEPRHGYALMKRYRDRVGPRVNTGNFYRELQRLVEDGLVRSVDRRVDGDARQAPYAITEAGRNVFRDWFADMHQAAHESTRDDGLTERLAFLADVPPAEVHAMLERWQDALWTHAKVLERSRESAQAPLGGGRPEFAAFRLIIARRIRHVAAELVFVAELRESYVAWLGQHRRDVVIGDSASDRSRPRSDPKRQRTPR